MTLEKILRSFGSGVIVYVIVAACASTTSERGSSPISGIEDARVPLGDRFMPIKDGLAPITDRLTPIKDARAQTEPCGVCASSGKQQIVTADSDPAQQVGGFIQGANGAQIEVAAGPVFITDLRAAGSTSFSEGTWLLYTIPAAQSCAATAASGGSLFASIGLQYAGQSGASGQSAIHGGRMFVSATERLCVSVASATSAGIRWSGFKAY